MLTSLDQAFQYIQDFTGMVTPGVVVVFLFGLFWKRANATAALWTIILTIPVSVALDLIIHELPFLDRMGIAFLFLSLVLIGISIFHKEESNDSIIINEDMYKTSILFNVSVLIISGILGV